MKPITILLIPIYLFLIALILFAALADELLRWHYPIYGTRRIPL